MTVIAARGKLRNGVFLEDVSVTEKRISFRVLTSRPFGADEFASLQLADDPGTEYAMVRAVRTLGNGHTSIEFTPGPLRGWSQLRLIEPGWGLHIVNSPKPSSRSAAWASVRG